MNDENKRDKNNNLRRKAELILKKSASGKGGVLSENDMLKLIQELEIHQIELEVQNEELDRIQSIAKESSRKYSELYDFSPSGYFTLSRAGEIREVNLTGANMLGMNRSVILNSQFNLFVSADYKQAFRDFIDRVFSSSMKSIVEIELINRDKNQVRGLCSGIRSEDEQTSNIIVTDISLLKKAKKEIEAIAQRSKQYLDIANVILISIDSSGNVLYINPKGCEVLGYPEEEITGTNWFDKFIPHEIREEVREVSRKVYTREMEAIKYYENTVITSSGEERLIAWHNSVLCDEDSIIISTLSSGEDITDRKMKEEELRKYRNSLEYMVKERTMDLEKSLKDLSERNSELERFFNATVNRELKMEELRVENIELKTKMKENPDSEFKNQD